MTETLGAWLERPGLDPALRLAILAKLAVGAADWPRLEECAHVARSRGLPRELLEETLLQAVLFFGFPRVVTAFQALQRAWPTRTPPSAEASPPARRRARGEELFGRIYGDSAPGVQAMLRGLHGELHDFVLEEAYGRVLARPWLDARSRELLAVAALERLDQKPQLMAHARGASRCGATAQELREALLTAADLDVDRVEALLRRIGTPKPGEDGAGSQTP